MTFNPLGYPMTFRTPKRATQYSAWLQHIPFAFMLMSMLKPTRVVELGVYYGDSYCAFCQAVSELGLKATCTGIDTWEGDDHQGHYGPEVLASLRAHHDPLYGKFSTLVQSTFSAAPEITGIDLLHIDGFHDYQSVRHDYETWAPRLSQKGVVLFHDIASYAGPNQLWSELRRAHHGMQFNHGGGLGMLVIGPEAQDELVPLLASDTRRLGLMLEALGERIALRAAINVIQKANQ